MLSGPGGRSRHRSDIAEIIAPLGPVAASPRAADRELAGAGGEARADARRLFAADIAFYYVTPPAHNGHVTKWIEAIDRINKMDVDVIVPGHGPIGTKRELSETRAYLELIAEETRKRHRMGMSPGRAAADIDVGRFATWTNPERTARNTVRIYAEHEGTLTADNDSGAQQAAVTEYLSLRKGR